ncbi:hypothetical protein CC86DRAFT_369526 [Ophiobolus disseminans]|uniref:Uncharacterized protein n=1 Tax=Ophiobolus disseminans TaxID=1469910 RepID=A0A6A7A3K3_9PLEO|nr:hypothetical protein CC86DRAFT_369526 [Ophiobolus disseminans]
MYLPAELWQAVFEQYVTYDVHIFNQSTSYRRRRVRALQALQPVCRRWRDVVRPLIYRHPSFEGWHDDNTPRFLHFVDSLDHDDTTDAPKQSWIQSFVLYRNALSSVPVPEGATENDEHIVYANALASLIPHLLGMREFVCRVVLRVETFALLSDCHAHRLTKLLAVFKTEDLREMLPLLNRFSTLKELQLSALVPDGDVHEHLSTLEAPELSSLCVLEIINYNAFTNHVLGWFAKASLPHLREFRVTLDEEDDPNLHMLSSFLARNGSALITLGLHHFPSEFASGSVRRLIGREFFAHTPHLECIELANHTAKIMTCIPNSVVGVTLKMMRDDFSRTADRMNSTAALAGRSLHGSKLTRIRVTLEDPHRTPTILSFADCLDKKQTDHQLVKKLLKRAAHLKERGILFLDDTGTEVTAAIIAAGGDIQEIKRAQLDARSLFRWPI